MIIILIQCSLLSSYGLLYKITSYRKYKEKFGSVNIKLFKLISEYNKIISNLKENNACWKLLFSDIVFYYIWEFVNVEIA